MVVSTPICEIQIVIGSMPYGSEFRLVKKKTLTSKGGVRRFFRLAMLAFIVPLKQCPREFDYVLLFDTKMAFIIAGGPCE